MLSIFNDSFLRTALMASLVVGVVCAYLGVYVVLRRIVFVGAALAQVSSAGVGLAMLLNWNPSVLALAMTFGGVAAFSIKPKDKRITQESFIGIGYALASALAVLFVAKSAQGEGHMLDVLSGDILTVTPAQVWLMVCVGVGALLTHILFAKQLTFSAFDPETAQASGIRSTFWDLLFFLILGVVISLSIRLAGTLLTFAFLVMPPVTALLLTQKMGKVFALSILSASIATTIGLIASVRLDVPSGPSIATTAFILLAVSWVISRFR
ncbi:MAG: metal ABC transporter permease [Armatimonadota bacterium]|nr:metal ABC transporter permease [bacterium]